MIIQKTVSKIFQGVMRKKQRWKRWTQKYRYACIYEVILMTTEQRFDIIGVVKEGVNCQTYNRQRYIKRERGKREGNIKTTKRHWE